MAGTSSQAMHYNQQQLSAGQGGQYEYSIDGQIDMR